MDTSCGLRVARKSTASRATTAAMVTHHRVGDAMESSTGVLLRDLRDTESGLRSPSPVVAIDGGAHPRRQVRRRTDRVVLVRYSPLEETVHGHSTMSRLPATRGRGGRVWGQPW